MKNMNPTWQQWLRGVVKDEQARQRAGLAELGPHCLGMITGQDARALAAVAACWQLHASSDEAGAEAALCAAALLLAGMQQCCWPLARALIAHAMDWSDIEPVWVQAKERAARAVLERVIVRNLRSATHQKRRPTPPLNNSAGKSARPNVSALGPDVITFDPSQASKA